MIYNTQEIEKLFIGSLIADNDNIIKASDIVKIDDLTVRPAATSYKTILRMFKENKPINLQSFLVEPELSDCFEFLVDADEHGIASNCVMFAEQIAESAKVKRIASRIKQICLVEQGSQETLADIKDLYSSEISGGGDCGDMASCLSDLDERVSINRERGSLGFCTGFGVFSDRDTEYERGQLWAAGGYTNVGKTSLMIEMILRAGFIPKMSVHSTEMKKYQIVARLLAGMTNISHKLILKGNVKSQALESAKHELAKSGLKIYDTNRDFDKMWNQCRKDKMQGGLDIVFADYIQNFKRAGQSGYELFAGLGKDSLEIPQELDLTMVMFSQISTSEHKEDSGGVAFKGAGELGESCDIGLWLSKSKTRENCMLVEHRKNRHGAKKDFLLEFQPQSNRLVEV
jgi:replicative DNA helicase